VNNGQRDALQAYLQDKKVPSMIYYPVPLYEQKAYQSALLSENGGLPVTESLCRSVISLPMHTELDEESLSYICEVVRSFFRK
jgi:dTDP-4-amino-4,6-dideoxygalactose transaminase